MADASPSCAAAGTIFAVPPLVPAHPGDRGSKAAAGGGRCVALRHLACVAHFKGPYDLLLCTWRVQIGRSSLNRVAPS